MINSIEKSTNILYFFIPPPKDENNSNFTVFYPNAQKAKVFMQFIRRKNFTQYNTHLTAFESLTSTLWFTVFFFMSIFILFCIRRRMRLRRDGLISVYLDMVIAMTGSSRLRFNHRVETIFFASLLFFHFFLNRIYMDDFLFASFLPSGGKRIDSFEKIAKFKLPFLFDANLQRHNANVIQMLQ